MNNERLAGPNLNELELMLAAAIRFLAEGIASARHHAFVCTPEVTLWALEKMEPRRMNALRDKGDIAALMRLLQHCFALFSAAETWLARTLSEDGYQAGFETYDRCISIDDLLYVVESDDEWSYVDNFIRDTFTLVLRSLVQEVQTSSITTCLPAADTVPAKEVSVGTARSLSSVETVVAMAPGPNDALASALAHARCELLASDDGYECDFWSKVYISILGTWLEEDVPSVADELLARGQSVAYFEGVAEHLSMMKIVEDVWNGLGLPVRELLLREASFSRALEIIVATVKVHRREISEEDAEQIAEHVWRMVQRRAVYRDDATAKVFHSDASNDLIQDVRANLASHLTCHVVDRAMLPMCYREQIDETKALVVRLSELWLDVVGVLGKPSGIKRFFLHAGSDKCTTVLCLNLSFWVESESLWTQLFRFRRSIPVLYVFESRCTLVRYRFKHFSDLRAADKLHPRYWASLDISSEDWFEWPVGSAKSVRLPNGALAMPSVVRCVNDMTTGFEGGAESEGSSVEKADAPLPQGQRLIQAYVEERTRKYPEVGQVQEAAAVR
ncbi:hypothetical protein [Paraburkholderia sp. 32]|uniref:hypothetical protein n=1 Tax=Paraburkholderia sp. 32 TaxID=2991057 RepID=UPI003D20B519